MTKETRNKLNEMRSEQIEKIKEIKEINLNLLQNVELELVELIHFDCVLMQQHQNSLNGLILWITSIIQFIPFRFNLLWIWSFYGNFLSCSLKSQLNHFESQLPINRILQEFLVRLSGI